MSDDAAAEERRRVSQHGAFIVPPNPHLSWQSQHREAMWPQAHRYGQVQWCVPMLSTGACVGPVGQQHHDTVKAVAHHCHMQGCVSCGACAVHVTASLQQHSGHLGTQTRRALRGSLPEQSPSISKGREAQRQTPALRVTLDLNPHTSGARN